LIEQVKRTLWDAWNKGFFDKLQFLLLMTYHFITDNYKGCATCCHHCQQRKGGSTEKKKTGLAPQKREPDYENDHPIKA
jgi:hypothetical protein